MRITRVYTRTGDKGNTALVGGKSCSKDATRIHAYGTVDELNSTLGLARTFNNGPLEAATEEKEGKRQLLDHILATLQNDLFNVGADLATPSEARWDGMYRVGKTDERRLEGWIDQLNDDLPPLKEFILPGGGPVGGFLHQGRTICRRAERVVVSLVQEDESVGSGCLVYLNRLSDLLFVMARWAAKTRGEPEFYWQKPS